MLAKIDDFNREDLVEQEIVEQFPQTLQASLERFYPELQNTWDEGEQITDTEGGIISRTFTELSFSADANLFIFEDTGFDGTIEERYQYRVHLPFTETEYYSGNSELFQFFKRWEKSLNNFFQEIIYSQTIIAQPRWERPIDYTSATLGSCPIGDVDPTPTDTGKDDYTFVPVPIGDPYPPASPPLDELQGGYCFRYENLAIPFILTLSVGRALGAVVQSDGAFILELGDGTTWTPVSNGTVTDPILLVSPQLRITFAAPDQNLPTFVQVDLYGEEVQRGFLPSTIDEEPDDMFHTNGSSEQERLQPPGKNFPDNFWNQNPENNTLEDFNNRQSQDPGNLV